LLRALQLPSGSPTFALQVVEFGTRLSKSLGGVRFLLHTDTRAPLLQHPHVTSKRLCDLACGALNTLRKIHDLIHTELPVTCQGSDADTTGRGSVHHVID